jgi:uncharacterized LabA/DUF88 family protein
MIEEMGNSVIRIKVFIDYWNLQLLINEITAEEKARIDWQNIGQLLAKYAAELIKIKSYNFEGANIYTSYNPRRDRDGYFKWVNNWLNRQPGIQVYCLERQTKQPPKCPTCHKPIEQCPHCKGVMIGSIEKGVDALIVTDMIRLAWENAYDIAVLVSSDRDLIPGVKFLDAKGKKVIHAGFPPIGSDLAQACWASFNIGNHKKEVIRLPKKAAK